MSATYSEIDHRDWEAEHEIKMLTFGVIWVTYIWEPFVLFLQPFSELFKIKCLKNDLN